MGTDTHARELIDINAVKDILLFLTELCHGDFFRIVHRLSGTIVRFSSLLRQKNAGCPLVVFVWSTGYNALFFQLLHG